MYQFNHILLCLDSASEEMDNALFAYLKLLLNCFPVQTIDFLQVINNHKKVSEEEVEAKLAQLEMAKGKTNFNVIIKEGSTAKRILKHAKNESVDLIIVGRNKDNEKAKEMGKVVNSAHCSVLLVPQEPFTAINKIVAAIDFSEHNVIGLKKSTHIANTLQAELILVHVYYVPSGYHISGKSYKEYAEIMEKNAKVDAETFLKRHPLETKNYRSAFILDEDQEPSDKLYEFAENEKVDLICITSTGLNAFTDIFFNSTAEMLFKRDNSIPMLVVKDKKESKGILGALRDL